MFKPLEYRQPFDLFNGGGGGVTVELRDAGHTLGSAVVRLTEGSGKRLVFTGDLGRRNSPILRNPDPFHSADAIITECTYGGKTHTPLSQVPLQLTQVINQVARRHGVLMIPAFALGRTQSIVELIHELRLR
ncbi:MAG: hypothetical protein FWD53_13295, partial [Phycisphaerales bacterium]|nr:hypothetical protein [Phycisphaerales bacterium]